MQPPTTLGGLAARVQRIGHPRVACAGPPSPSNLGQDLLLCGMRDEPAIYNLEAKGRRSVHPPLAAQQTQRLRRPLPNQSPFKLSEHGSKLSHRPSMRRAEVDTIDDAHQPHRTRCEAPQVSKGLSRIAAKSIQADDHNGIQVAL